MSRAIVVGVLNCTPDSFSDGGEHGDVAGQVAAGLAMAAAGADWIDVGGESTRPGAETVSDSVEIERVVPVIEELRAWLPAHIRISIDSRKPAVAARALDAGATILNDVSGLIDPEMVALTARAEAVVVMHMRGAPADMAKLTDYDDLVAEVRAALLDSARRSRCATVYIDPGIGFAKTAEQSLSLLKHTAALVATGYPVLVGASRKSFIGRTLDLPHTGDRLAGSLAAVASARSGGAAAFRVHDVAPTRHLLDLLDAIGAAP